MVRCGRLCQFLVLLLCCLIALPACSPAGAGSRRDANTLVVLEPGDANSMNPLFANNAAAFLYIYGLIFDGLADNGPNFGVIPALAVRWASSRDHLHWNVTLRRGVRWSDGRPFSSRDVTFTWKTMLDPEVGFPYAGQFAYVKHVVATSTYGVRFDLSSPNALFELEALNSPILPEHILGKLPAAQQRISSFGQQPVGTGPYMLSSWQHDDTVLFVRNPHWWRGAARIPRIQIRVVLDNNARVDAMVDGSADLSDNMGGADFRTMQKLAPGLRYVHIPDLFSEFIAVNLMTPGLDDLAVRRAMMYGWDRRALVDGLLHKDGLLNDSITPFALRYWHDEETRHYPYGPQRARELLERAGWRLGSDGVRQRGGLRLAFTILLATGSAGGAEVSAAFQADMRAIGIAISLKTLDYATFIDDTNLMHYQLALTGWGGTADPDQYTFLHSSQLAPAGNNYTGYKNAVVDRDLVLGLRTLDPARRRVYYDQMQQVVSETLPCLFAWDAYFRVAYSPRLSIDRKTILPDLNFWWNVWDWRLDAT